MPPPRASRRRTSPSRCGTGRIPGPCSRRSGASARPASPTSTCTRSGRTNRGSWSSLSGNSFPTSDQGVLMLRLRRITPSPALVVACVALVVALAGTGYAALKLPRNSVTTVQVKDHSLLARDFKRGQLPAGPQGPPGPAGAAGPGARWALVGPSGSIIAQSGGISARHAGDGYYVLDFGSAITGHLVL